MANECISENAGWSQWVDPLFQGVNSSSNVYFGTATDVPSWRAMLNTSTGWWPLDDASEQDDHNAPCTVVRPGKDRHTFYTRHNQSEFINHQRATTGIEYEDQGNITFPGACTYASAMDYNNDIVLVTRTDNDTWRFKKSSGDWGTTWGGSKRLFAPSTTTGQKYYLRSPTSTAGLYHIVFYGHPNGDWRGMTYGTVNLADGKILKPSTGSTQVANLSGTNLPLNESSLDDIVPTTGTEVARLYDVATVQGKPTVGYVKWDTPNSVLAQYYYAYLDGGTWHHVATGVMCGASYYSSSHYYAGMAFDKVGNNKVAFGREASGTSYVDVYPIDSSMAMGTKTEIKSDATYRLAKVKFAENSNKLYWGRLIEYVSFQDYRIHAWMEDFN